MLEDALAAAQRATENARNVTVALQALGDASLEAGQVEEARTFFQQALTEASAIRSPREQGISGIGLARAEMAAGQIEEASTHIRAALESLESLRAGLSSPDLRASYLATAGNDYRTGVEILMALDAKKPHSGFAEEAFSIGEQGRARSLLDVLSAARVQVQPAVSPLLRASESTARGLMNDKAEFLIRLLSRKHTEAEAAAAELDVGRAEDSYKQAQQADLARESALCRTDDGISRADHRRTARAAGHGGAPSLRIFAGRSSQCSLDRHTDQRAG